MPFLLIQGPLLGISEHPSIPYLLFISLIRSSRGISHHAQEEKEFLFQRPVYTWKKEQANVRVPYLPPLKATDALAENFPQLPPPLVQNHFSGTQNHSPENFKKIWESGLFLLWRKGDLFDKRGDRCDCT
jgi:hypothetical protein